MDIVIVANFCLDFSATDNGRFSYLAKELAEYGHNVEIITTTFNHGTKKDRCPHTGEWPFRITFIEEPGYKKNISLQRFYSHFIWGNNVKQYFNKRKKPDVIYCAVPSLTGPFNVAKYCEKHNIRFIVDIQDLWPEAFKMVFNIPILSDIIFEPFNYLANSIYKQADEVVAVSQTYVDRAMLVNKKCETPHVVFLGTELSTFDQNAKLPINMEKETDELWLAYCGTLGSSYDLTCVFDALEIVRDKGLTPPKFIVMGDGPRKEEFEKYAEKKNLDVTFTGKLPYDKMCSLLKICDITVNPIVHGSAATIINKHGDYASAGLPVLNTQESKEYRLLVEEYNMGFNCDNSNSLDLAEKLTVLLNNRQMRVDMGNSSRRCAEEKFDRKNSYREIIEEIIKGK